MRSLLFLFLIFPMVLPAQTEAALRAFFEGKYVQSRVDLPATYQGLDVHYRKDPPVDQRVYQSRLSEWGPGVRSGAEAAVTMVRVKGKNIEFQLAGGGLHESATVDFPTYVPKSRYEEDLERDMKKETDAKRKDSMRRELDRMRSRRSDEERRLRAEKQRLEAMKLRELHEKAHRYGSRINIWFEKDYLKESVPTPQELMRMLDEWVDFSPLTSGGGRRPSSGGMQSVVPLTTGTTGAAATSLRKGMEPEQVRQALGVAPERYKESKEGSLLLRTEAFELRNETVEVDYVEGLVVRWRVSSK